MPKVAVVILNFDGVNTFNCGSGRFTMNLLASIQRSNAGFQSPSQEDVKDFEPPIKIDSDTQIVPFMITGAYNPALPFYKADLLEQQSKYCKSMGGNVFLIDLPDKNDQFGNIEQWQILCQKGSQLVLQIAKEVSKEPEFTKVIVIANDTAYAHIPIEVDKSLKGAHLPIPVESVWIPHCSAIFSTGRTVNGEPVETARFQWELEAVQQARTHHYKILPIGQFMLSHLQKEYRLNANDVKHFFSGIIRDEFLVQPNPAKIAEELSRHKIPLDKKLIFSIGRGIPNKGHDLAVKMFAEVAKTNADVHLVILSPEAPGEAPDHNKKLAELIKSLGLENRVTLITTFEKQLAQHMYAHPNTVATTLLVRASPEDLIPMESRVNPTSSVLLVSNRGSNVYQVTDGRDGFVADIGREGDEFINDAAKKLQLILDLSSEERQAIIDKGKIKIAERYDAVKNFPLNFIADPPLPELMSLNEWKRITGLKDSHPVTQGLIKVYKATTHIELIDALYELIKKCNGHGYESPHVGELGKQAYALAGFLLNTKGEMSILKLLIERAEVAKTNPGYLPISSPITSPKAKTRKQYLMKFFSEATKGYMQHKVHFLTHHGQNVDEKGVALLSAAEKEKYRVFINDGLFFRLNRQGKDDEQSLGIEFADTKHNHTFLDEHRGIFVVTTQGDIFIGSGMKKGQSQEIPPFFHSSFLSGKAVFFAGLMEITHGRLKYFDNASGHYQPDDRSLINALRYFKEMGVIHSDTELYAIDRTSKVDMSKGFSLVPRKL